MLCRRRTPRRSDWRCWRSCNILTRKPENLYKPLCLQAADWRHLVPDTQEERLAVLEELQQIPLKLRAEQQQPLIFA